MIYDKQMLAWALDRAIETSKLMKDAAITPDTIMAMAKNYCDWIAELSPDHLPEENQEAH